MNLSEVGFLIEPSRLARCFPSPFGGRMSALFLGLASPSLATVPSDSPELRGFNESLSGNSNCTRRAIIPTELD